MFRPGGLVSHHGVHALNQAHAPGRRRRTGLAGICRRRRIPRWDHLARQRSAHTWLRLHGDVCNDGIIVIVDQRQIFWAQCRKRRLGGIISDPKTTFVIDGFITGSALVSNDQRVDFARSLHQSDDHRSAWSMSPTLPTITPGYGPRHCGPSRLAATSAMPNTPQVDLLGIEFDNPIARLPG